METEKRVHLCVNEFEPSTTMIQLRGCVASKKCDMGARLLLARRWLSILGNGRVCNGAFAAVIPRLATGNAQSTNAPLASKTSGAFAIVLPGKRILIACPALITSFCGGQATPSTPAEKAWQWRVPAQLRGYPMRC